MDRSQFRQFRPLGNWRWSLFSRRLIKVNPTHTLHSHLNFNEFYFVSISFDCQVPSTKTKGKKKTMHPAKIWWNWIDCWQPTRRESWPNRGKSATRAIRLIVTIKPIIRNRWNATKRASPKVFKIEKNSIQSNRFNSWNGWLEQRKMKRTEYRSMFQHFLFQPIRKVHCKNPVTKVAAVRVPR